MALTTKDRNEIIAILVDLSYDYMTTQGCPPDMEGMPRDAFRALVADNTDPCLVDWAIEEASARWGNAWQHYDAIDFEDLVLRDVPLHNWEKETNQFLNLRKIINEAVSV